MANLSQIKTDSDWGLEASKINQNFNQVNTELTTLKNTTSVRQPLFSSTTEATKNIPSPYVGQLILVGSTIPAPIYRWNGSSWVNTGQTGGSAEVSLTNYYTKTDIDNQRAELESKIGGVGYITCETASGTAAKTITLTGLTALSTGIRLLVKMTNANTASNATLNINSFGAKPLYYNNKQASVDNSWEAGEVIDIYYDGTNFYSSNVQGGSGASGNIILEWNTDAATTRKQVKQSERKALLQISYNDADNKPINEQYIGTAFTDTEWAKDSNWKAFANKTDVMTLQSSISSIESGNLIKRTSEYAIEDFDYSSPSEFGSYQNKLTYNTNPAFTGIQAGGVEIYLGNKSDFVVYAYDKVLDKRTELLKVLKENIVNKVKNTFYFEHTFGENEVIAIIGNFYSSKTITGEYAGCIIGGVNYSDAIICYKPLLVTKENVNVVEELKSIDDIPQMKADIANVQVGNMTEQSTYDLDANFTDSTIYQAYVLAYNTNPIYKGIKILT